MTKFYFVLQNRKHHKKAQQFLLAFENLFKGKTFFNNEIYPEISSGVKLKEKALLNGTSVHVNEENWNLS